LNFKGSPGKKFISKKKKKSQNRASRVAQGVGSEFKPQYLNKKLFMPGMVHACNLSTLEAEAEY
jgi:hypothetical protein